MRIVNARWLAPDGTWTDGVMDLVDGRLRLLPGAIAPAVDGTYDAAGQLIVPGFIDPHVHLREPGQSYKEGIRNGTRAALAGGVTTLLDMPNNKPPTSTARRLEAKRARFRRKSLCNWGLFLQATPRSADTRLASAVSPGICALKVYMAKSSAHPGVNRLDDLMALFRAWPVVALHAEDDTCFCDGPYDMRNVAHHVHRPRGSIQEALAKIERALRVLEPHERPRVIILHAATMDEVAWLLRMKADGFDVHGETCPHYLLFTDRDQLERGGALKCNPPIRGVLDRMALRDALANGALDFVATDHAPHAPTENALPDTPPSGIAGIEWLWPLLLHGRDAGWVGDHQLTGLSCAGAARCYGIPDRDGIRDGNAADLAVVEHAPDAPARPIITKAGFDPFEQTPLAWRVRATFVSGVLSYDHGRFTGACGAQEVYAP
jgi:dihydroorotase